MASILQQLFELFLEYIWKPLLYFALPAQKLKSFESDGSPKCLKRIPGPKGWPFIGDIMSFNKVGGAEYMVHYVSQLHKDYGPIVRVKLGPIKLVFISSPHLYRQLVKSEPKYPKSYKPDESELFNEVQKIPRGLFFQDGEKWKQDRNCLKLALNEADSYMPIVMRDIPLVIAKYLDKWETECQNNSWIPGLEEDCYRLFLECISTVTFGSKWKKYLEATGYDFETLLSQTMQIKKQVGEFKNYPPRLAKSLGLSCWKQFENLTLTMLKAGHAWTEAVLNAMKQCEDGGSIEEFGLIRRFADVFDVEGIKRHCTDFILDIPDPGSITLLWGLANLGMSNEVQEKLHAIVQAQCPDGLIKYEHLEKIPYLTSVCKESLRISPTAPFISRRVEEELNLDDYIIPTKHVVCMSVVISQNDPKLFLNPEKFWPERWLDGKDSGEIPLVTKDAYFPFGLPNRFCKGYGIMNAFMRLFLGNLCKNFRVECNKVEGCIRMIFHPKSEVHAKLIPR